MKKILNEHQPTPPLADTFRNGGAATIPDHRPAMVYQRKLRATMQEAATARQHNLIQQRGGVGPNEKDNPLFFGQSMPFQMAVNDRTPKQKPDSMGEYAFQQNGTNERVAVHKRGTSAVAPVYQLQRDVENDKVRLGEVYDDIKNLTTKPDEETLRDDIYDVFGYEPQTTYEVSSDDFLQIDHDWFAPQEVVEAFEAILKNSELKEKHEQIKQAKEAYEKHLKIDQNVKDDLFRTAYQTGDYFVTSHPRKDIEKVTERMVINTNNQKIAIDLLNYLNDCWKKDEGEQWGDHVTVAKFLSADESISGRAKYDKVVLYYEKEHRGGILAGVQERVPDDQRNEKIGAFYDKQYKGIGVADQIGYGSFTNYLSTLLSRWILNKWEEIKKDWDQDKFVEKAKKKLLCPISFEV